MLASIRIVQQVAREIHKFLWQGGKSNQKKFHLVNWKVIKSPKEHGRLGIKDPLIVNITLGAKVLWTNLWKARMVEKILSEKIVPRKS